MGYRTYIGKIKRSEYEKIKNLSPEELNKFQSEDDEYYFDTSKYISEIYEFGKDTQFDDENFYTPFFTNEKCQELYFSDTELWVVEKDYLKHIIEHYRTKIISFYESRLNSFGFGEEVSKFMSQKPKLSWDAENFERQYHLDFSNITDKEASSIWNIIHDAKSNLHEWKLNPPYDLDGGDEVSLSWKYEYAIFELVRIYKQFDWENDILVYYGY